MTQSRCKTPYMHLPLLYHLVAPNPDIAGNSFWDLPQHFYRVSGHSIFGAQTWNFDPLPPGFIFFFERFSVLLALGAIRPSQAVTQVIVTKL